MALKPAVVLQVAAQPTAMAKAVGLELGRAGQQHCGPRKRLSPGTMDRPPSRTPKRCAPQIFWVQSRVNFSLTY